MIVIDSVAALVPGPRSRARWRLPRRSPGPPHEPGLRKFSGTISKSKTTAVHQPVAREDRGAFGCFSYGTRVTLADGTQEKIGKIVNQFPVEVLSYDPEVGAAVVPKKVVGWFDNGCTDGSSSLPSPVRLATGAPSSPAPQPPDPHPGGWRRPATSPSATGSCRRSRTTCRPSSGRSSCVALMGDGAPSPSAAASGPGSVWDRRSPDRSWRLEGLPVRQPQRQPETNADGAVFHDVQPLPSWPSCGGPSTSAARRSSGTTTSSS